ncbi:MAG: DUF3846 domain-containing protein [Clostridia bacterium]|nr:DUF3846 domain-containing protein [Clostridia bacterium]
MMSKLIFIILACALFAALGALGEKMLRQGKGEADNSEEDEPERKNSIRVLIKPARERAYLTWIKNTQESFESIVGGHIKSITIANDMVIVCNDEVDVSASRFNTRICGEQFFGDIIICGASNEGFDSIPVSDETVRRIFCSLFAVER